MDSGLPLGYRGAVEQDVNQAFAQQALKVSETSDTSIPSAITCVLDAIASSDASKLNVRRTQLVLQLYLVDASFACLAGIGVDNTPKKPAGATAHNFTLGKDCKDADRAEWQDYLPICKAVTLGRRSSWARIRITCPDRQAISEIQHVIDCIIRVWVVKCQ